MFGAETPFFLFLAEGAFADAVELQQAEEGDAESEGDGAPDYVRATPGVRESGGEGGFAVVGSCVEMSGGSVVDGTSLSDGGAEEAVGGPAGYHDAGWGLSRRSKVHGPGGRVSVWCCGDIRGLWLFKQNYHVPREARPAAPA
jgi:hypothetical protein